MSPRGLIAPISCLLLAAGAPAFASGSALGLKAINTTSIHDGHPSPHFGAGIFLEQSLIDHALELELSTSLLSNRGVVVPVELLAKVPFYLTESLTLSVGAGPLAAVSIPNAEPVSVHFGFVASAGATFWVTERMALMLAASVGGVIDAGLVPEIGGAAGVVMRL
jgi:hypothetical protein